MDLTLDQVLQKGVEAHKAGKAEEADQYYTAILKANPKHPDANHNMGVLAVGVGKVEVALPFFKAALEANPTIAQYWLSYINALIQLERMADAKAVLDQAKQHGASGDGFDKLKKALTSYEKGVELKANSVGLQEPPQDQLQPLVNLHTQGKYQEALNEASQLLEQFPNSWNLYNIIGAINTELEQLEAAVQSYKKATSLKPDFAEAYNNMGAALSDQLMLEAAVDAHNKAISINPNFAEAHNNIGVALQGLGKLEEAVGAYEKAIFIKNDYAEAFINMGNALKEQGKIEQAIDAYKKSLLIRPDYAEAFNNMGVAFMDQLKLPEAIEAYNKAIAINPNYAEAFNNLGVSLKEQNKFDDAIIAYTNALANKPHYAEAYNNLGNALKNMIFKRSNQDLQETLISLIKRSAFVRPQDIAKAAISLLKLEPTLQKYLQSASGQLIENTLNVISDITEFPLLLQLMRVCPLPDLELEGLLTNLRFAILSNISSLEEASPELMTFQSALALQCFTNEYIYNHSEEEETIRRSLEASVEKALKNNEQPSPQVILILASYKALNEYDWCNLLVITDHIKDVFKRQVEEPNQEQKLKQEFPILEEITDSVSSEVREQYEERPYPRWVKLGLYFTAMSIPNVINQSKLKLHHNKITEVDKPKILIAGCGTGQHSIETASRFKNSKVLAIDLSLSSLAYAKRKTEELAVGNIDYKQADILDASRLNEQFDIIESVGVLHHMANPMAGWKVLTDCLKPGGLMKVGLYSELARQNTVKIREEISELSIEASDAEMKSFRDMIIKSEKDHHRKITKSLDFYSLSTLKDLLFHVQEHRFTIPLIKHHLDKLELKFCGFETKQIVSHFQQTNTGTNDLYDLDKWQAYEEANPRAFVGMYQFWCQKME